MNNSKIRLGISLRIVEETNYEEKRDALSHDWLTLIENLNAFPILIPNNLKNLDEFLLNSNLDGLILSGGDNIGKNPERDRSENTIIGFGLKQKIPIFGVCRGMQIINNYFGGSININSTIDHVKNSHNVQIINSKFSDIIGKLSLKVNSYHNNTITTEILGKNLDPFAISGSDRTVEGFFHTELPIVGVMWHPERSNAENSELILRNTYDNNFWK
jgi:putative glutamine amidotransferase